jgi:energy-converting hydrogenase Eha subunit B
LPRGAGQLRGAQPRGRGVRGDMGGLNSARFLGQMSCQLDHAAAAVCAA